MNATVKTSYGTGASVQDLFAADAKSLAVMAAVAIIPLLATLWWWNDKSMDDSAKEASKLPLPPGSWGLPVIHDQVHEMKKHGGLALQRQGEKKYGSIWKARFLFKNSIFISDPALVRKVTGAEYDLVLGRIVGNFDVMMGAHSVVSVGAADHRRLRRILAPCFSSTALAGYTMKMQAIAEQCCREWADAGTIGLMKEVKQLFFKITTSNVVGLDPSQWPLPFEELYNEFLLFSAALLSPPVYLPGTTYWKGMAARRKLLRVIQPVLEQLRAAPPVPEGQARSVLQVLAHSRDENGELLSIAALKDNALAMLWASQHTTNDRTLVMLSLLAEHPEIYARVQEEQRRVVAKHGTALTEAALQDMPYTSAVIKEVIRYPQRSPVSLPARYTLKTFRLGDYKVPKGWYVYVSAALYQQNDPRWLGRTDEFDPNKFNPERFLVEGGEKLGHWGMIFGSGRRMCPGYQLAQLEMKVVLSTLARGYRLEHLQPDEEWRPMDIDAGELFPFPVNGYPTRVTRCA